MCKRQVVQGGIHVGQTTKVGFDTTRRLISREIAYEDERHDGDIHVRLGESSLLLTFTSKSSKVPVITHYI